jgi:hypothetical protein
LPPEHEDVFVPPPSDPGELAVFPPPSWSEPALVACLFVEEDEGFTAVVHAATTHAVKNGTTIP